MAEADVSLVESCDVVKRHAKDLVQSRRHTRNPTLTLLQFSSNSRHD